MTEFNFKMGVGVFENGDAQLVAQVGGMAGACVVCTIKDGEFDAEALANRIAELWNAAVDVPREEKPDA